MTFVVVETKSGETNPRVRPSWFQEWTNRQFLAALNRERQSLLEEDVESFRSGLATSTGVSVMTVEDDFWKAPFVYVEIKMELATENDTRIDEEREREIWRFRESIARVSIAPPISGEEQDMLDWDAHIETPPPPRSSGAIKVMLKYIGPRKPIPLDDPYA
jgi:hypothetical protein